MIFAGHAMPKVGGVNRTPTQNIAQPLFSFLGRLGSLEFFRSTELYTNHG